MRFLSVALFIALPAAGAAQSSEIATGAVAHADVIYLAAPDGAVAAHDPVTGAQRWVSDQAARPLAAAGGRLLAQAAAGRPGQLGLVVLDATTGRPVADVSVRLPPGVSAPIDDTAESRFLLHATPAGREVRLDWAWEHRPMRGALLEGEDDGGRRELGALAANLAEARVSATEPRPAPGPTPLPVVLAREADGGAFRERPLRVGALFVATQPVPGGGLVLKRWTDAAMPLPDAPLPEDVTLQLGSADARHLLVSREIPGAPFEASHEWSVIALDTGARVAVLRTSTGAAPFLVVGGRVLVVQPPWERRTEAGWRRDPRRIEAFDRSGGALAWTHEIRDTAYRGPVAP